MRGLISAGRRRKGVCSPCFQPLWQHRARSEGGCLLPAACCLRALRQPELELKPSSTEIPFQHSPLTLQGSGGTGSEQGARYPSTEPRELQHHLPTPATQHPLPLAPEPGRAPLQPPLRAASPPAPSPPRLEGSRRTQHLSTCLLLPVKHCRIGPRE